MSDSLLHVVVPYSRFVECQHRRDRIAAELTRRDQPPTIDADAKKNGIAAVGVLYGYGSERELIEAGASHICATPRAVLDHISAHIG